jgi:molecular chaperone GrpE
MPTTPDPRDAGHIDPAGPPEVGMADGPAQEVQRDGPAGAGAAVPVAEEELAALRTRVAELADRYARALADLDNMRKRSAREAARQRDEERAAVASRWLPILDALDLALEHADAEPRAIVDGVRNVRAQAWEVLARLGYPRRAETGEPFDPGRHEVVAAVPAPETPAGTVVQVMRPGYGEGDHQLRPAAVVVATGET